MKWPLRQAKWSQIVLRFKSVGKLLGKSTSVDKHRFDWHICVSLRVTFAVAPMIFDIEGIRRLSPADLQIWRLVLYDAKNEQNELEIYDIFSKRSLS